jgi:hypothetical protein
VVALVVGVIHGAEAAPGELLSPRKHTGIGAFVHVPSWKVSVKVGDAPCPVPAEAMVAVKALSVPTTLLTLAVVPNPAEREKSPATRELA